MGQVITTPEQPGPGTRGAARRERAEVGGATTRGRRWAVVVGVVVLLGLAGVLLVREWVTDVDEVGTLGAASDTALVDEKAQLLDRRVAVEPAIDELGLLAAEKEQLLAAVAAVAPLVTDDAALPAEKAALAGRRGAVATAATTRAAEQQALAQEKAQLVAPATEVVEATSAGEAATIAGEKEVASTRRGVTAPSMTAEQEKAIMAERA